MLKKALILVGLTFSLSATSATISYNGYSLNTTTNIVTGGGLEWLQWTETLGLTANQAVTSYEGNGWRIATHQDITTLFNAFDPISTYSVDENISSFSDVVDNSTAINFLSLLGDTWTASGEFDSLAPNFKMAGAMFGSDNDNDGLINFAQVSPGYSYSAGYQHAYMKITGDGTYYDYSSRSSPYRGVALVRVSAIPIPAAAWLFSSALIGLAGFKRKH